MRAFAVAWRAIVSLYNDLFLLIGMNLIWWLAGGFTVAAAVTLGWPLLQLGGPWWLMPLLTIPAGPATAALACVARQSARDLHADRGFFWQGLRAYWRQALALNAISMAILSLLLLNLLFYRSQSSFLLQVLSFFWACLVIFWIGVQIHLFPVLVGLREPTVREAFRTTLALTAATPFHSVVLVVLAAAGTALCIVLAPLLVLAWPALMILLGEHSLKLFVERMREDNQQNA